MSKKLHTNSITAGSQRNFAEMPSSFLEKPRSTFIRNSTYSTSFNAGRLVPIYVDEILPGDSIDLDIGSLVRMATPIAPIMANIYMDIYAFFVPNRLVWNSWEDFISGKEEDTIPFYTPTYWLGDIIIGESVDDINVDNLPMITYLGITPDEDCQIQYNALEPRAYFKIWRDWFIPEFFLTFSFVNDSNEHNSGFGYFDNSIAGDLDGEFNSRSPLLPTYKLHDLFTSALDNPQRGGAVSLPLGDTAPVYLDMEPTTNEQRLIKVSNGAELGTSSSIGVFNGLLSSDGTSAGIAYLDPNGQMYADLATATAVTVNDLRLAISTQKLLEKDNYGQRYAEILQAHFGVTSPDARLQRSEFLAHKRITLNMMTVLQNSSTEGETTPLGSTGAFSATNDRASSFVRKSFVEHGYFMVVATIRSENQYFNSIDKSSIKRSRLDYYWPSLANIGNQPIPQILVSSQRAGQESLENQNVFGYGEAWFEYRFKPSKVTGLLNGSIFEGTNVGSLEYWTLGENIQDEVISEEFLRYDPAILDQCLSVNHKNAHQFICNFGFVNKTSRVMPVYSIPSLESKF